MKNNKKKTLNVSVEVNIAFLKSVSTQKVRQEFQTQEFTGQSAFKKPFFRGQNAVKNFFKFLKCGV